MTCDHNKLDKALYRKLRTLSCAQLWDQEVPRFDRSPARERIEAVALVRAVGVVFAETGTPAQKEEARRWLRGLLHDPAEKVRRYAMTALPKLGADPADETELLRLLGTTTAARERKFLGRTLDKIGRTETLKALPGGAGEGLRQTEQKVRAAIARTDEPSAVRMESRLEGLRNLRIHLRCRRGLEGILAEEVLAQGEFRVLQIGSGFVAVTMADRFSLAEVYELRCFASVGFVLGEAAGRDETESLAALAAIMTSPLALQILRTFTEGSIRYRIEFIGKGHQRGAVRALANLAYARCPEILNDAQAAPWTMAIHSLAQKYAVELSPRLRPDPRFAWRLGDVPAASHPPLAACLARLSGPMPDEIVWDPFCGSGLELIERTRLGGVRKVFGTDRSAEAVAIAGRNFAAAALGPVPASFTCGDFRDFARVPGLGPRAVTLIITNPPMGKRVPIPNLHGLMAELLAVAATVLRPGGRLVFPNPVALDNPHRSLALLSRRVIDLGGFECRLEVYRKNGFTPRQPVGSHARR